MIYAINFADKNFESAQKFNSKMAKRFGADRIIEYSPDDIDERFKKKNSCIWNNSRGCGYWIWKPYIVNKTLERMQDGDYLLYSDSGSCIIDDIHILIDAMENEKTDIMIYCLHSIEKNYSKRDAFIIMECDQPEYTDTPQRCATYFLLKKTERSRTFISEWLSLSQDRRIITNEENVLGLSNYEGFVENRHDQTIFSLLSKKWGINPFRDPGSFGLDMKYPKDVLARSPYLQVFDDHRYKFMPKTYFVYKHISRKNFEKIYRIFHK